MPFWKLSSAPVCGRKSERIMTMISCRGAEAPSFHGA